MQRPAQHQHHVHVREFPTDDDELTVKRAVSGHESSSQEEDSAGNQAYATTVSVAPFNTLPRVDAAYKKKIYYFRHLDGTVTPINSKVFPSGPHAYSALPTHKKIVQAQQKHTQRPDSVYSSLKKHPLFDSIDKHSRPSSRAITSADVRKRKADDVDPPRQHFKPRSPPAKQSAHIVNLHPGDTAQVKFYCN